VVPTNLEIIKKRSLCAQPLDVSRAISPGSPFMANFRIADDSSGSRTSGCSSRYSWFCIDGVKVELESAIPSILLFRACYGQTVSNTGSEVRFPEIGIH
jgi:hypothetical protein